MNWYQITVHTVTEAVEAISYAMEEMGAKGVEIVDPKDILWQDKDPLAWDYIDEDLLAGMKQDVALVRCYISEEELPNQTLLENFQLTLQDKVMGIAQFLPIGEGRIETATMAEDEWANAWKQYYKPFHIGEHIFVVPSWEEAVDEPGDIRITMDPGMAFGTGTHETTSMCAALLEEEIKGGETVLDVGCGSGILGITAAKLGASKVICTDLDPNAVLVAKDNVVKNQVAGNVEIYKGDLLDIQELAGIQADCIVANIIADVIIHLAPSARGFLKEDGLFLSSGIIRERRDDVEKSLAAAGYTVLKVVELGSWVAIVSRKS
ncbi:MAG: 50S ribosomal protein L11 methyltransferase [Clostridia bacterium]